MGETPAATADAKSTTPERFDDILARLRAMVDRLEGGNLSLEEGLRHFEEGMELCRRGAEILDRAEKRVEVLLSTAGGVARTAPFEQGGGGASTARDENDE